MTLPALIDYATPRHTPTNRVNWTLDPSRAAVLVTLRSAMRMQKTRRSCASSGFSGSGMGDLSGWARVKVIRVRK